MRRFIRRFLQPMFCEHNWELLFDVHVEDDFGSTGVRKHIAVENAGCRENINPGQPTRILNNRA